MVRPRSKIIRVVPNVPSNIVMPNVIPLLHLMLSPDTHVMYPRQVEMLFLPVSILDVVVDDDPAVDRRIVEKDDWSV